MPKNQKNDAAFTLTEVVVAVVLMLLALGLLLSGFISTRRSVALAQTQLAAMQIARNEAERVQTNTYVNITNYSMILTNAGIEYTMNCSVTTNGDDSYKDITIAVGWSPQNVSRRQSLTNYTIICNTNRQ